MSYNSKKQLLNFKMIPQGRISVTTNTVFLIPTFSTDRALKWKGLTETLINAINNPEALPLIAFDYILAVIL